MTVTLSMPQLGLTMTEATVGTWLKKPGDAVCKDEPLLSISTDKVDMDIESTVDGVLLKILVPEGQTVPVGTGLAHIEAAGKVPTVTVPAAPPSATTPSAPPRVDPIVPSDVRGTMDNGPSAHELATQKRDRPASGETFRASPRARRRAKELGIDIEGVRGTGPDGRVVEQDLLNLAPATSQNPNQADSKRRQTIAATMLESIRTIPPFSISLEVNAEKLVALYDSVRDPVSERAGARLTYTDLLFRALALALAATPEMNVVWEREQLNPRKQIVLALAVATDRGAVAPVIAAPESLTITQLVSHRARLTEKARHGRLAFADLEGAAGTLSNLGMYRVDRFQGIISPGQSFLLAVGKLSNRPWVQDTSLVIRPTVVLNLSVDHRVADGATAAVFLECIAETIENPYRILWNE